MSHLKKRRRRRRPTKGMAVRGGDAQPSELRQAIDDAMQVAVRHHREGRPSQAAELYARVLEADPQNADAWHLSGVLAHQAGDHQASLQLVEHAIQLNPASADYRLNLGAVQAALGHSDRAIASYEKAISLNPGFSTAWNNLGNVYKDRGDYRRAIDAYDKAIELEPQDAHPIANRGSSLLELSNLDEAEANLKRALRLAPGLAQARSNLGLVQTRKGNFQAAIESFSTVLAEQPNLSAAWRNLRNCLNDVGSIEVARRTYQTVARAADAVVRDMLTVSVCPVIAESIDHISEYRNGLEAATQRHAGARLIERPDELITLQLLAPFYLPYQGRDDRTLKEAYARVIESPNIDPLYQIHSSNRDGEKLRIGFPVSLDRQNLFLRFMRGFVDSLVESGDFEVIIPCAPANVSTLAQSIHPDATLLPLPRGLKESAEAIAKSSCDILFYLEVGSDSLNYFLPFYRAAPVQATTWGIPVTTGIPQMDYFISSGMIEPDDGDSHYSETLVKLKSLPVIYDRPVVRPKQKSRADFGLAENENVYGCLQSPFKNHPEFDSILAAILRRDWSARIVLVGGSHETSNAQLMMRMHTSMPDVAARVRFFPRMDREAFNDLMRCCDVLLDTIHFGGGATSYEALSMGVPVITLPGRFMRGRVTEGCYKTMGLIDCVANDKQDYVDRAVSVATSRDLNQHLRREIVERSEVLFCDEKAGLELAEFFQSVGTQSRQQGIR